MNHFKIAIISLILLGGTTAVVSEAGIFANRRARVMDRLDRRMGRVSQRQANYVARTHAKASGSAGKHSYGTYQSSGSHGRSGSYQTYYVAPTGSAGSYAAPKATGSAGTSAYYFPQTVPVAVQGEIVTDCPPGSMCYR